MQWILVWYHSRLGSPSIPLASVTQTTSNGFLYYSELSPPVQQKVAIKRGLFGTYWINIRDWAVGDVMWCGVAQMIILLIQLVWKPETKDPRCRASILNHTLSNSPLILNDPMHARHTHTSHHHDHHTAELLIPGKKIVTAHHTSISLCAKQTLPSDDLSCTLLHQET